MLKEGEVYHQVREDELSQVAAEITAQLQNASVWLFHGDLGSGKTTLIKKIGENLRVTDAMSSPSFSIINEYFSEVCGKIFHFDFYRIKSEMEAFDIGIEEYFYSGFPCFIEWPEKIPSLIPPVRGEVTLNIENESTRTIAISVHAG